MREDLVNKAQEISDILEGMNSHEALRMLNAFQMCIFQQMLEKKEPMEKVVNIIIENAMHVIEGLKEEHQTTQRYI